MHGLLLAVGQGVNPWNGDLWYAVPLVIAVSLVYAATRHERMRAIVAHAMSVGMWIVGFMAVVFAVIGAVSWWAGQ